MFVKINVEKDKMTKGFYNETDSCHLNYKMYFSDTWNTIDIDLIISCNHQKDKKQETECHRKEFINWWNDPFHYYSECLRDSKIVCLK